MSVDNWANKHICPDFKYLRTNKQLDILMNSLLLETIRTFPALSSTVARKFDFKLLEMFWAMFVKIFKDLSLFWKVITLLKYCCYLIENVIYGAFSSEAILIRSPLIAQVVGW